MIVPTKGVAPQRALLAVGAQIVIATERQPVTINQAWRRLLAWREANDHRAPLTFWWFALSLDLLFAMGLVELERDVLIFRARSDAP
ncbi:ABC-three component system middle component 6 [Nonomuraea sp. ATR24]|uniref:ABC-three component system middle component 6 n=1 Tax=Nonomuraea TaxID=83681 RepID=UPI001C5F5AE4|nr:ABC-three component system middle component 6 [Nonomuraea ceibae]